MEKTTNAEVIIADNASTDDSVNYVTNNFPSVKLILNKTTKVMLVAITKRCNK